MTPGEYHNFVINISSFIITIQIEENAWGGEAPLAMGDYDEHKQELVLGPYIPPKPPSQATVTYPSDLGITWIRGKTYNITWTRFT